MFKLRNFTIVCTKWAHFKFDACYRSQNSWDGGNVDHGVASPLLFKTVWRRLGIEVMSFWSFGVGIWSHSCLIMDYSCWRVRGHLWRIFRLMMCQMFSIGERSGLQVGQFSTWTLLLWSHAVVIAAVCGFALSCWNTHHLEGSICCSKTFIYLSAFIVPSKTCNPIPSEMLAFELNADNTLEGLPLL